MTKIRVGVIGTGWGQLQIESFKRAKNCHVVALCDTNLVRLQDVAKAYKIDQTFSDYHKLIASNEIDLVSVASPPDSHQAMTQAAIDAGKHVLVEKPLALNMPDAIKLLESAEQKKIVHAVNFEMRFLPALAYSKELIDEQYLGQLHRVDVTMGVEQPWGERGNWLADDVRGGGILMELGSHFIDTLRWWFGDVRSVLAGRRTHFSTVKIPSFDEKTRETILLKKSVTGDDAFWAVFQFAQGGEALLNFVTGARHDPGWTISAYGSMGSLIVNSGQLLGKRDGDREMTLLPIPKRLELGDNPKDPLMWSMAKVAERMVAKINHESDLKPFPDFRDGIAVEKIIDAIRCSSDTRGWVDI
ncbi:MAG: Gfo/Idh/MocA family oxidoreductase [Chloroflexi bacterium]|nr:Gfo/Idh/MocA family oxidoreductase [Chloroflexota bacterium]